MKLVRCSTGEVMAAWTLPNSGHRKKGKMSFLMKGRAVFGEMFELMAVTTVLALMEKRRRKNSAAAGGAAVGGAAAGGGGGGGGGC